MNSSALHPSPSAAEEAAIGQRVHAALEVASASLPADVAFRLGQSRELALTRYRPRRRTLTLLQFAGIPGTVHWMRDIVAPSVGIVLLALLATAASQHSQAERFNEMIDIDSALLTDDLPIDAYLDRGFGTWLDYQGNP